MFTNPVIGGENTLIRSAIRSPDYVAGVSGWTINKDGTAEFNNAVFRGEVLVTDPDGSYVRIYDENPGDGALIEMGLPSGVGVTQTPGRLFTDTSIPFFGMPGIVLESPSVDGAPVAVISLGSNTTSDTSIGLMGATDIRHQAENDLDLLAGNAVGVQLTQPDGQFNVTGTRLISSFDGRMRLGPDDGEVSRGWVAGAIITANNAGVINSEAVQLSALDGAGNPFTFRAGRAYKVVVRGGVTTTATASPPLWRLKKTNTGGQQFDVWRTACTATGTTFPATYTTGFRCDPANDVTAIIVLTLTAPAGVTIQLTGAATSPAVLDIYDDGIADNTYRSGLPVLV